MSSHLIDPATGFEDVPLVELPTQNGRPVEPAPRREPNAYVVACPNGAHRAGIVPLGKHYAYRMHSTSGALGQGFPCSASLRPVCELPPATRPDIACRCTVEPTEGTTP